MECPVPSHIYSFEYRTPILSGIQVFGFQIVTVHRMSKHLKSFLQKVGNQMFQFLKGRGGSQIPTIILSRIIFQVVATIVKTPTIRYRNFRSLSHIMAVPHLPRNLTHLIKFKKLTRQVYNLFQEPVEQLPLGLSIAEEKNQTVLKTKQLKN